MRPPKRSGGWWYWAVASVAAAVLGWIWWQHRVIGTRRHAENRPIYEAPRSLSQASKSPRTNSATTPGNVQPVLGAPPSRIATNIGGLVRRSIRPGISNPASVVIVVSTSVPPRLIASAKLSEEPTNAIRFPKSVFEIQVALARQAISCGIIDGKFGPQTRAALRALQEREHLPLTGDADTATKVFLPLLE